MVPHPARVVALPRDRVQAVVNKDPKKSKYSGALRAAGSPYAELACCTTVQQPESWYTRHCSAVHADTLHRFCKKEHDWGWKKFMELSKVLDGFTVADTLVIKAQVQVIL
jgi:hypothetical protein